MAGPTGNPSATPPPDQQPIVDSEGRAVTLMRQWMRSIKRVLQPGISITVSLAKLTAGGTNGSIQVVNGIVTSYTAPT
jgi:hypothetical protein